MRRRQLFEICDQPWCPKWLRCSVADLVAAHSGQVYKDAAGPILAEVILRTGARQVVDLGSGTGGPWASLRLGLPHGVQLRLTDLYDTGVVGLRRPVDAACVPAGLDGLRTCFSLLHHFDDAGARAVLEDAVAHADGFAAFEFTERRWSRALGMLLSPIAVWVTTAGLRPARPMRWLFTYLLPVIPLVYAWDGAVSHLRSRSAAELLKLTEGLDGWIWRADRIEDPSGGPAVTWLLGWPEPGTAPKSRDVHFAARAP